MPAKSILVTGATDGIGRETARQLLALGHRVLVHGRDRDKAEHAAEQLKKASAQGEALPVWGDLSRMREIPALARQVRSHCPTLDVLLNNAGVMEKRRRLSEDGFEMTMAVNHYAPFLLTRLLLDLVEAAPAGRVVTVSSMVHSSGGLDLSAPSFLPARGHSGYDAYCASKLANVLFTAELARRLAATKVTANCLHPGVIDTKLLHAGFAMTGSPVEEGARTSVFLATSGTVAGISGRYFNNCREAQCSAAGRDLVLARSLWQATEAAPSAFAH
ncbi:MAG: SDR family NAD(P)-dependent oxidoreductase [Burkholderiales bacterium]|jgi:NAD(P)-dependent dehydrogenase (short-subunit alcohol dehydrogenase family)